MASLAATHARPRTAHRPASGAGRSATVRVPSTQPLQRWAPRPRTPQEVLTLQRSAGNTAVQRALQPRTGPGVRDGEEVDVAMSGPGEPVALTDREVQRSSTSAAHVAVQRDAVDDVAVTIPRIQAPSSPAGTPDRIPPRVDTSVAVTVAGWHAPLLPVRFSVVGGGGSAGNLTINGAATADLTAGGTLLLRGTAQTAAGSGGGLRIAASIGTKQIALSAGFTVAAIPQNFSVTKNGPLTGAKRGVVANNSWESDSGSTADLDEVRRSEKVEYGTGTGMFAAGVAPTNSGYRQATSPPIQDSHGIPTAAITAPGAIAAQQVFVYKDDRTGVTDIPVRASGFLITRTVVAPSAGTLHITTEKTGTGGTAKGFTTTAGAGSISEPQAV